MCRLDVDLITRNELAFSSSLLRKLFLLSILSNYVKTGKFYILAGLNEKYVRLFFISLNIKTRQAYLGTRILLLNIYLHHAVKTFTFMARFLPVVSKCLAALTKLNFCSAFLR